MKKHIFSLLFFFNAEQAKIVKLFVMIRFIDSSRYSFNAKHYKEISISQKCMLSSV